MSCGVNNACVFRIFEFGLSLLHPEMHNVDIATSNLLISHPFPNITFLLLCCELSYLLEMIVFL